MQAEPKSSLKYVPAFSIRRIKKTVLENDRVGKISHIVPPLIDKSLQFFLLDLLQKSQENAKSQKLFSISRKVIQNALTEMESYGFMKDVTNKQSEIVAPQLPQVRKQSPEVKNTTKSQVQCSYVVRQQKIRGKMVNVIQILQTPIKMEEESW